MHGALNMSPCLITPICTLPNKNSLTTKISLNLLQIIFVWENKWGWVSWGVPNSIHEALYKSPWLLNLIWKLPNKNFLKLWCNVFSLNWNPWLYPIIGVLDSTPSMKSLTPLNKMRILIPSNSNMTNSLEFVIS